ncbi:MAG: histidine phosphatase family protein [Hyphomicrobiales bacterium]|nr:histidine phosphatase family protein [Hyphomicrobiales bacterium]MCP5373800.1 histidine phosphatase family protein [Hyphomicrobiales bacterium]
MKTLYLLRHAKSSWKDPGLADFDRPLKGRGRRAAKAMAGHMADRGWRPDLILCSAAARTTETLALLDGRLGPRTPRLVDEGLYMAAPARLMEFVNGQDDGAASILMIGHNPGLEQFAVRLTGGAEGDAFTTLRQKFPTAALAVLRFAVGAWRDVGPRGGRLEAFVRPVDVMEAAEG